ncbi:DNA polymerase IV domain protein, partial [Ostertagia ostertagi]
MKDWVNTMREGDSPTFSGRAGLKYLASPNFVPLTSRVIFHVDLDCFFVSVALRDRPDLIGKPVAITHSKGVSAGFSELASVSYAARDCGLQNGMIVRDAIKLCPNLVCLPYLFDDYRAISKAIYTIVARYTLEIRAVSCDEMYVDCTKLFDE